MRPVKDVIEQLVQLQTTVDKTSIIKSKNSLHNQDTLRHRMHCPSQGRCTLRRRGKRDDKEQVPARNSGFPDARAASVMCGILVKKFYHCLRCVWAAQHHIILHMVSQSYSARLTQLQHQNSRGTFQAYRARKGNAKNLRYSPSMCRCGYPSHTLSPVRPTGSVEAQNL
jgi:hypothetical protein